MDQLGDKIWLADSGKPGRSLAISFGVHGNERAPIEAGLRLVDELERGEHSLVGGRLLLMHANPRASEDDERWSQGGVDLNRCFHADVLAKEPELYEEGRARELVAALEQAGSEVLVDFHCTVEPGQRFLMQHPPVSHEPSREAFSLLRAEILLADPSLTFGGVSFDEYMTTRGRVGLCYETGWMGDPANTPEAAYDEMHNLLTGYGLLEGEATQHPDKELLELNQVVTCEEAGYGWREGVGENLQFLAAGTVLGSYASGKEVKLADDAVLVFPKKKPELVQLGKPLVYLAARR